MDNLLNIAYDLGLKQSMYCIPKASILDIKENFPVNLRLVNTENTEKTWELAEIYWGNRIEPDMIEKMPKLKWIHFGSVGVNRINNLKRKDLIITSSKGLVNSAMSSNIISLIGCFSRNLNVFFNNETKMPKSRDEFEKYFDSLKNFDELQVLILGLGNIGQYLAKKLYSLGVKVDAVSRKKKNLQYINKELSFSEIYNRLNKYDFVISLLPENNSTKNILNYDFFSNLSENSIFLNAGRGSTCVEKDLIYCLDQGNPKLVILDVLQNEPLSAESEIFKHPKTFLTPHIFAFSPSYWPKEINLFKKNLTFYLKNNFNRMENLEYI